MFAAMRQKLGYAGPSGLPAGIEFTGPPRPTRQVRFLADLTWVDENGARVLRQEIFDEILAIVRGARRLLVIDAFLFNDRLVPEGETARPLCRELTDAVVSQRERHPELRVWFITDPCNEMYGNLVSPELQRMREAGIDVVTSDVDALRDGNRIYSFLWRCLIRPFGNRRGGWLPSPLGPRDRVTLRTWLKVFNMKANHRKTLLADRDAAWVALVSTANPHDASHAHGNVALRFDGEAVLDLLHTELAVLELSGLPRPVPELNVPSHAPLEGAELQIEVLTESSIRNAVVETIDAAGAGDRLDMVLFYLADKPVLAALKRAAARGVVVRGVLDPSKDAFGWKKTGQPNRQVAYRLRRHGVQIRWAVTNGEQAHSKMLLLEQGDRRVLILGSANFTRRNLCGCNLETDVRLTGPATSPALARATDHFDELWQNRGGRNLTEPAEVWEDGSLTGHALNRLMELTGLTTW